MHCTDVKTKFKKSFIFVSLLSDEEIRIVLIKKNYINYILSRIITVFNTILFLLCISVPYIYI